MHRSSAGRPSAWRTAAARSPATMSAGGAPCRRDQRRRARPARRRGRGDRPRARCAPRVGRRCRAGRLRPGRSSVVTEVPSSVGSIPSGGQWRTRASGTPAVEVPRRRVAGARPRHGAAVGGDARAQRGDELGARVALGQRRVGQAQDRHRVVGVLGEQRDRRAHVGRAARGGQAVADDVADHHERAVLRAAGDEEEVARHQPVGRRVGGGDLDAVDRGQLGRGQRGAQALELVALALGLGQGEAQLRLALEQRGDEQRQPDVDRSAPDRARRSARPC